MSKLNIKLTSQEGVTLHTEGTYCEKSIAVIPHLESITVTPTTEVQNITPSEGYAGIGSVRVEAGGEARPYFDGTVVIEKAESGVLGLRRFKEIIDLDTLPDLGGASGIIAEFNCQDTTYATMVEVGMNGDTYLCYYTSDSTRVDAYSITTGWQNEAYRTVDITKCDDEYARAWLLANTEGVSV